MMTSSSSISLSTALCLSSLKLVTAVNVNGIYFLLWLGRGSLFWRLSASFVLGPRFLPPLNLLQQCMESTDEVLLIIGEALVVLKIYLKMCLLE